MKKTYILLLEQFNYTPVTLFKLGYYISNLKPNKEILKNLNKEITNNYPIEIRMVFNTDTLLWYEDFCIKNGILFDWIKYKDQYIGIKIYETEIDLNPILLDCLTFEKYTKYRKHLKILEI